MNAIGICQQTPKSDFCGWVPGSVRVVLGLVRVIVLSWE